MVEGYYESGHISVIKDCSHGTDISGISSLPA
jgi:hypothetical protein